MFKYLEQLADYICNLPLKEQLIYIAIISFVIFWLYEFLMIPFRIKSMREDQIKEIILKEDMLNTVSKLGYMVAVYLNDKDPNFDKKLRDTTKKLKEVYEDEEDK